MPDTIKQAFWAQPCVKCGKPLFEQAAGDSALANNIVRDEELGDFHAPCYVRAGHKPPESLKGLYAAEAKAAKKN